MARDQPIARFASRHLPGAEFVRYPASVEPVEGTMASVDNEHGQRFGQFIDGRWCNVRREPIKPAPEHWAVMEVKRDA